MPANEPAAPELGAIEAGKLSHFAVLEADPQAVEPAAIVDIPVIATVLGVKVALTSETRPSP